MKQIKNIECPNKLEVTFKILGESLNLWTIYSLKKLSSIIFSNYTSAIKWPPGDGYKDEIKKKKRHFFLRNIVGMLPIEMVVGAKSE